MHTEYIDKAWIFLNSGFFLSIVANKIKNINACSIFLLYQWAFCYHIKSENFNMNLHVLSGYHRLLLLLLFWSQIILHLNTLNYKFVSFLRTLWLQWKKLLHSIAKYVFYYSKTFRKILVIIVIIPIIGRCLWILIGRLLQQCLCVVFLQMCVLA